MHYLFENYKKSKNIERNQFYNKQKIELYNYKSIVNYKRHWKFNIMLKFYNKKKIC